MNKISQPAYDFDGKDVLITGATGSFGQAFVKALCEHHRPSRVIVFSRDELKQYEMAQKFTVEQYPHLRYFIGDVRDCGRLEMAMRGVTCVVHAAALKHVSAAEYNPFECIHTNVLGAENVVKAAIRAGVERVIALSTDKAASPLNIYGASKLASDKIFIAANNLSGTGGPIFSVVRYGNVIGSRGSVIPFFNRLVAEGRDSLPITDDRMTRFWIALRQGVEFVMSSFALMKGGEIFVPKLPSMKIVDLARTIAPNLRQEIVGIRAGEKLHEVLITSDDARMTLEFADRYVITSASAFGTNREYSLADATPVSEDFRYVSNENKVWLTSKELIALMDEGGDG